MPKSLFHYTTKNGHDAIMKTMKILPSTLEGKEHTHFGKGIYFGVFDPYFDAQFLGIKEIAADLFGKLTKSNFEKFFYFVEVVFPDGYPDLDDVLVTDDKDNSGNEVPRYVNKYLWLLNTEEHLLLCEGPPQPGCVQVISHGLTYWGQLRELASPEGKSSYSLADLSSEVPGWKKKPEQKKQNWKDVPHLWNPNVAPDGTPYT